jgi:hypothetical protein
MPKFRTEETIDDRKPSKDEGIQVNRSLLVDGYVQVSSEINLVD